MAIDLFWNVRPFMLSTISQNCIFFFDNFPCTCFLQLHFAVLWNVSPFVFLLTVFSSFLLVCPFFFLNLDFTKPRFSFCRNACQATSPSHYYIDYTKANTLWFLEIAIWLVLAYIQWFKISRFGERSIGLLDRFSPNCFSSFFLVCPFN